MPDILCTIAASCTNCAHATWFGEEPLGICAPPRPSWATPKTASLVKNDDGSRAFWVGPQGKRILINRCNCWAPTPASGAE